MRGSLSSPAATLPGRSARAARSSRPLPTISSLATARGPRWETKSWCNTLKNAKRVKDAASESERNKFLTLIQYFQQYGDKYDVDWLLMAVQGYQESQLNQAIRSKVGAIGVMQVLPGRVGEEKPHSSLDDRFGRRQDSFMHEDHPPMHEDHPRMA
jgi:hypothetical protein